MNKKLNVFCYIQSMKCSLYIIIKERLLLTIYDCFKILLFGYMPILWHNIFTQSKADILNISINISSYITLWLNRLGLRKPILKIYSYPKIIHRQIILDRLEHISCTIHTQYRKPHLIFLWCRRVHTRFLGRIAAQSLVKT